MEELSPLEMDKFKALVLAAVEQEHYPAQGGGGGSGVVILRYQIGVIGATAKATGGSISFYSAPGAQEDYKTIHTFTSSGVFNATEGLTDVEYLVVGGGGAGGTGSGGGGGAGGFRTGTVPSVGAHLDLIMSQLVEVDLHNLSSEQIRQVVMVVTVA